MVMIAAKKRFIAPATLEEYLAFEAKSEGKHEFINGKIVEMPGATGPHCIAAVNIATSIKKALKDKKASYFVMGSDMKIYIEDIDQVRYPDAVVICDELIYHNDSSKMMLLSPLLIGKVLSPSTQEFDRTTKFEQYKHLPSFKEYLLVHQERPLVSTYFREEEDLWRIRSTKGLDQHVPLRSIEVELALEDIYEHIEFEEKLNSTQIEPEESMQTKS
ncbi:MAG: Uma2 family endonuclease [Bacteroidota bacterium]